MTDADFNDFVSYIDRSGGAKSCHNWTGNLDPNGYGRWRGTLTHRLAYELKNGSIPEGAVVRHDCDNPSCCNPSHLRAGSHEDNRADCVGRGRHAKRERNGHAKLTTRQVAHIRNYYSGWTHDEIAQKYGVARSTITRIRLGRGWDGVGINDRRRSTELKSTSHAKREVLDNQRE